LFKQKRDPFDTDEMFAFSPDHHDRSKMMKSGLAMTSASSLSSLKGILSDPVVRARPAYVSSP